MNVITAAFNGSRYCTTKSAFQLDKGDVLKFVGIDLPEYYEVHFSNSKNVPAKRVLATGNSVVIPSEFMKHGLKELFAWVYLTPDTDVGYTPYQVTIPLALRSDISDAEPDPEQEDIVEQAISALNDGVDRAETAADNAEQSAQDAADAVEHVQQTVNAALQEAKDSGEFDGRDGTDGQDGVAYTPTVDASGVISWTNDGGRPNPQPRNIKGPQGDKLTYADLTPADKADLIQGPIAEAQTAAVAAVNSAGTTQVGNVNAAGAAQVEAVEDKGEDVLASIPADYTELSEDVDELKSVKASVIIDTASGAIASFPDGADGVPVKSLTVAVEPVQDLHGYDSPWPAGGGKNLVALNVSPVRAQNLTNVTASEQTEQKVTLTSSSATYACLRLFYHLKAGTYTVSFSATASDSYEPVISIYRYSSSYKLIVSGIKSGTPKSFTISEDLDVDIRLFATERTAAVRTVTFSNVQIESGSTATSYAPYSNICPISGWDEVKVWVQPTHDTSAAPTATIQIGETVYGGQLDVTGGKMVVDRAIYAPTGDESSYSQQTGRIAFALPTAYRVRGTVERACSAFRVLTASTYCYVYTDFSIDELKFYFQQNDVQIVAGLATPFEITLTAQQIDTLLGTNNIWSNAGNVSVDYRADTKLYIQKINAPTDVDMTADAQIATGKYFIIGNTLYKSATTIPAGDTIIPGTNCIKTDLAAALNALNA